MPVGERRRTGWFVAMGAAVLAALAFAASAHAFTIYVDRLASALKRSPVQTLDHSPNTISTADAQRLARLVARRDPGRIYIAVVPVLTARQAGQLAQDLANVINRDGVYIVVGGYNYHVTTTWQTGDQASRLLGNATGHQGDSLRVQMRKTIDAFAAADAKAGHPGASSPAPPPKKQGAGIKQPTPPTSTSTTGTSGTTSTPASTQPAPVTVVRKAPHKSSSSNIGLIVLLVALGLLVLAAAIWGGIYARTSMRVAHRRHERSADIHAEANADLVKLGEQIEALDIDSQMPNASAEAKSEYAAAIECYEDAEQRMKKEKDEYQFERAQDEIRKGLVHVAAAKELFDASSGAAAAPAAAPAAAAGASPPAGAPAEAGDDDSTVAQVAKLARLHERGVLTDAEFEDQKRKLIGE